MKHILSDDLYTTEVEFVDNTKIIFPDIATLKEMYYISERLHTHLEKLKTLNEEEKLIAKKIIETYKGYSEKDKQYLLYHINL